MKGILLIAGILFASPVGAAGGGAEGAWRRIPLPGGSGIVTSLAAGGGWIAAGTSGAGVVVLDSALRPVAGATDSVPGARSRIRSLAWSDGLFWGAGEGGLFAIDPVVGKVDGNRLSAPSSARTGAMVVWSEGATVWAATRTSLVCFLPGRREGAREWQLPIPGDPTVLLKVGGRILLGTATKGLFLLDSSTGGWLRFGRTEGMASDQVTGLEWVGAEVFVATPEGVDLLDLSSQKIHHLLAGVAASWMTQSNGSLFLETTEGLLRIDATTKEVFSVSLPSGAQALGALLAREERLVVGGGGSELLVRPQPTILGGAPLQIVSDGFALSLDRKFPDKIRLQAFLRIPEWPEAKLPATVELEEGGRRIMVRLPSDMRGAVQVDLVAMSGSRVEEVRSLEGVADRSKPQLALDPVKGITRDSSVEISGRAAGIGPLAMELLPAKARIDLAEGGAFRRTLRLGPGRNAFQLVLQDGIGNRTSREFEVRRDDRPPLVDPIPDDTVAGDFARVRVPFHEDGAVSALLRGPGQNRVSVFDSFAVVELRRLGEGTGVFVLTLEDEAGNQASRSFQVHRRRAPPGASASSWSIDNFRPFSDVPRSNGDAPDSVTSVHVVHYRMVEGETLCGVAEWFYGTQALAEVLIQWNGFADSSQWRRMPVGTPVDVPFWRDIDYRNPEVRSILESFPWDRVPQGPRSRR